MNMVFFFLSFKVPGLSLVDGDVVFLNIFH